MMAAYNGAALIGESIESLLRQTFTDFELVIVDDCSTDDTAAVVASHQDPRIRLLRNKVNLGVVGARNTAFAHARGEYIAVLDQDDLSRPNRLAAQVAHLDAHPGIALVASRVEILERGVLRASERFYLADMTPALLRWMLHLGNPLFHSSVMFRADVARQLRTYLRKDFELCEDYDFYLRLLDLGELSVHPENLTILREHPGRASKRHAAALEAKAVKLLRQLYARYLGTDATPAAELVVQSLAAGRAVADLDTLLRLSTYLEQLMEAYLAAYPLGSGLRHDVEDYTGALWWRLVRAGIRAGRMPFFSNAYDRPGFARFGKLSMIDLASSEIIGGCRRIFAQRNSDATCQP